MATYSDMAASLREVGYRLTPQRMMILAAMHQSAGHITAEAIHERVKEQYPFVDISTVYRTLQLLKKLRLITETDLGEGVVEYELSERGRHHHLVCRQCGKTAALDDSFLRPLADRLQEVHGFEADLEHFAIFGICAACQEGSPSGLRVRQQARPGRGAAPRGR
jgi:Fur family ferric uptake transcriptional regulator